MVYRAMILAAELAVNFVSPQMSATNWRFGIARCTRIGFPMPVVTRNNWCPVASKEPMRAAPSSGR